MKVFLFSLIVLALLVGSLSGESRGAPDFGGVWKGATSQRKPISILVVENRIKILNLEWMIPLEARCGRSATKYLEGTESLISETSFSEILDGTFKLTFVHFGEDKATLRIDGSFDPRGGASGQLQMIANHCKGRIQLTWNAKRM